VRHVVLVAVDPGVVTGLATWDSDGEVCTSWQEPTWYAVDRVWAMLESRAAEVVICEAYTVTAATLRKTRQYDALESIGALRWMSNRHGVEFVLQTPADAKRFVESPGGRYGKLRRAGWYNPTPGNHAADAAAHLMLYLARNDVELFKRVIAGC
jgi:hypothetical protein